jgi:hypothetical protein
MLIIYTLMVMVIQDLPVGLMIYLLSNELDWDTITAKWWYNTEEDNDRERRKQAEFWVKNELSLDKIFGIGVYDDDVKQKVEKLCKKYNQEIVVKVKPDYFYKT